MREEKTQIFRTLAASRGTNAEGAVPQDTMIIFAIGGIQYSTDYNPWHWLTSKEAAEAMAIEVATWPDKYVISCNTVPNESYHFLAVSLHKWLL